MRVTVMCSAFAPPTICLIYFQPKAKMNSTYLGATEGTLKSTTGGAGAQLAVNNNTVLDIRAFLLTATGQQQLIIFQTPAPIPFQGQSRLIPNSIIAAGHAETIPANVGDAIVFSLAATGSFFSSLVVQTGQTSVTLNASSVTAPNDIGPLPTPTATMLIPTDTPRVVVGYGTAPNGIVMSREQYWSRSAESISLAAGESRTVRYSIKSGLTQTGSDETTTSTVLGASVSAGWGPVSASVNASLSTTTSSSSSFTITEERELNVAETIAKPGTDVVIFHWQLMDEVYFIQNGQVVASISVAKTPVLRQTVPATQGTT